MRLQSGRPAPSGEDRTMSRVPDHIALRAAGWTIDAVAEYRWCIEAALEPRSRAAEERRLGNAGADG
jgi:hypothetical protein